MYKLLSVAFLFMFVSVTQALPTPNDGTHIIWEEVTTYSGETVIPDNIKSDMGYFLYWRLPSQGYSDGSKHQIENLTTTQLPLTTIPLPDNTYFFAMTAYQPDPDNPGQFKESGFSTEIKVTVAGGKYKITVLPKAPKIPKIK